MRIYLSNEYNIDLGFDKQKIAEDVISQALKRFEIPYEASVSIIIVNDKSIKEVNAAHRNIDSATDVLSFPAIEYDIPGVLPNIENTINNYLNPEDNTLYLGDIMISLDRLIQQAKEYEHSTLREYAFLITHSILHLLGYDHMNEEDENLMFGLQKQILEELGINK